MIVTKSNFAKVVDVLSGVDILSLDTETTSLRPYHGGKVFAIILGTATESYYFNFWAYENHDPEEVLAHEHFVLLRTLLEDSTKTWYIHNAQFDMAMLANNRVTLNGHVHCTKVIERVVYNQHMKYGLDACAERIGLKKDAAVEEYIKEHKLWEWRAIPGKKQRAKDLFFYRVPPSVMFPYGCQDAAVGFALGESQSKAILNISESTAPNQPSILQVFTNEKRLTKTVFRMQHRGILIDKPYCERAIQYENDQATKALAEFEQLTGTPFKASAKLLKEVFKDEADAWDYTDKGNPSFNVESLGNLTHPAAKSILAYRDAKSRADFYLGFLYHADAGGVVHPNFNQSDTVTGRFSSSNPNFQNMTAEKDQTKEFLVRRAIIPRAGFVLFMPDYDQMEYRLMLDRAAMLIGRETPLIRAVLSGLDVHSATVVNTLNYGATITRDEAKTTNFATLYGSGDKHLAEVLGCTVDQARKIKQAIFGASPEIEQFINTVNATAKQRGYVFNWYGRRAHFPDRNTCYRATNSVIQGGCADVFKIAMNRVDQYLIDKKSQMIIPIHDELVLEVAEDEIDEVPKRVKKIMEEAYPYKYLPLTVDAEWSPKSLGDKIKGLPNG